MELMFFAILVAAVGFGIGVVIATRKGLDADLLANAELRVEIRKGLELLARRRAEVTLQPSEQSAKADVFDPSASTAAGVGLQPSAAVQAVSSSEMHPALGDDVLGAFAWQPGLSVASPFEGIQVGVNNWILERHPAAGTSPIYASAPTSGEYLTFQLGSEEYGIDIGLIQEIRSYEPPTRVANPPDFIKGVINLRGVIVPIVDLRIKLGCPSVEYNTSTVVIVLQVKNRVVGAVVDSVSDVLELNRDAIKPAPELSAASVDTSYITGIGSAGERMLILMDIEGLMSSAEMGLVDAAIAA